ncbi:MAG: hypothetical protein KC910_04395 [Candidatus Eremiobacteraeota bacterium]|nr:hypothetical protein [Candidatus Eremiobacteraeota bacterium]
MQPAEQVDCKKQPLDRPAVAELLANLDRVVVINGKKILELDPKNQSEQILATAIGRSGNLRAPSLVQDKTLVVGFNPEVYAKL